MKSRRWISTSVRFCPRFRNGEDETLKLRGGHRRKHCRALEFHGRIVDREGNRKAYEPRISIEDAHGWNCEADQRRPGTERERNQCTPVESFRIFVDSAAKIEILDLQDTPSNDEIVADHNSR